MEAEEDHSEPMSTAEFEAETLRRAQTGGRSENLAALELAVSGLYGGALSYSLALYLASGLKRAMRSSEGICGASFEDAFQLMRAKGAPKQERTAARDFELCVWVHLAEKRGLSPAEAKAEASDLFHVENVARILREVGPVSEVNEGACEEWLARAGKPLPPRH